MLPGHRFGFVQRKPTVSSSEVKKLHRNEIDKDAAPLLINDGKQNTEERQTKKRKADCDLYSKLYSSPKKTLLSSPKKTLLSDPTCDENNNNFNSFDTTDSKSCTVLRNWYLLISMNGELFMEGNVKCDIISRTCAIAKRFSNNKVQCIYKRIYILDGTLNFNKREVPEYVKIKFYNGFPEDWENVYQLWNMYLRKGWKRSSFFNSFKWPDPNKKNFEVISRWRVLINEKRQLIIEGTLECGRIERSKPIINRFSNKKVLSSCNLIYILDGTLVNEKNDIPDYVRWKFHNGFPVDWENVYQHWKHYLAKRVTGKALL